MSIASVIFWVCFAGVGYTYVGYPLALAVWAKVRGRRPLKGDFAGSYGIILAVHNEESNVRRRLDELRRLMTLTNQGCEIIVVADGCTDRTAEIVADVARADGPRIRLLQWRENRGKAAALNEAAAIASSDVLLFADARQSWADDTIANLLGNFADDEVGAVSGDLRLESSPGVLAGVGLYWRFEKWLRKLESRVHAQVGVTGAISGVRRRLFEPIPHGTVLDDVYWPLRVAMSGHRVVHDDTALAFDRLPAKSAAEFRRKVRTLAGNFQLVTLVPESLLPWRNPVWTVWVSHKLLRLASPWMLLGLFVTPLLIEESSYLPVFWLQAICYGLAIAGLIPALGRYRLLGAAASFLVLNAAAWVAFWVWVCGRTGSAWRKVEYREAAVTELESGAIPGGHSLGS